MAQYFKSKIIIISLQQQFFKEFCCNDNITLKIKINDNNEAYTDESKSEKVYFTTKFINIIKRKASSKEAFVYTVKISIIKTSMREIYNRYNKQ